MKEFVEVLEKASRLEMDGYEFYKMSASKSKNRLVKSLFNHLAQEEKVHYERIKTIADSILKGKRIYKKDTVLGKIEGRIFEEIFTKNLKVREYKAEIEALKIAEKMEKGSIKHYQEALKKASDPIVKDFISRLIKEEEGHLISIEDSIEYIKSPEEWFARNERSMYDGA
jgi:rubrerythrin